MSTTTSSLASAVCTAIAAISLLSAFPCRSQSTPESATREQCEQRFGVRIGHRGKDVIWVPTPDKLVTAMLEAAQTQPHDYVIDLGAGDGKIPIAAARQFGARALGIEYDADMVRLARCNVEAEGLTDKVEIRQADIFETDLSEASVVTLYLLTKLNKKLRPRLLRLEPGTRIVSNRFKMGAWKPDQVITIEGVANRAYLWIVPERIAGRWQFSDTPGTRRFDVRFSQHFQQIRGNVTGSSGSVREAKLRGHEIEFILRLRNRTLHLAGHVADGEMRLQARNGSEATYVGRRR